jgi:hypothetical protein
MVIESGRMRARHVPRMGEIRNAYKISVEKPTENRPFGRTRSSCEDAVQTDIKGCGGVGWIQLQQVRDQWRVLVNTVMNRRVS